VATDKEAPRVKSKERLNSKITLISRDDKMPFNLFHKKKHPEEETPTVPTQEEPQQETPIQPQETASEPVDADEGVNVQVREIQPEEKTEKTKATPIEEPTVAPEEQRQEKIEPEQEHPPEETAPAPVEAKPETVELASKTYLKAMPLKELTDVENVKTEVRNGNIIILRVTPLASKSIEDVKNAVNELFQFTESINGDIARLGEERVVICPKSIRIWREKTPAPVSSEPLPTSA
jgi:SepF-like predicted cell division protein (DUF552 family)